MTEQFTQIPDYQTLVDAIQSFVDRTDRKTTNAIPLAINNAEKWVMRYLRMPALEKMVEFTFDGVGLDEGWTHIPSDLVEMKDIWFFDDYSNMKQINAGTMQQIMSMDGKRSSDSVFARSAKRLYVRPKPAANTRFQMTYYRDLTEMGTGRASYLYEIAHDVLLFSAVSEVYRFLAMKEDADYFEQQAKERISQIHGQVEQAEHSGGVMVMSIGD